MYCPRCASQITEGHNFCRNCGLKLDVIVDAVEGRPPRGPLDFENLKRDLLDLGKSMRQGFEDASSAIKEKKTQKLKQQSAPGAQPSQVVIPDLSREIDKALRKVKAAHTRKYSLQQATLSIFGGGAWMAVWYHLLNVASDSGLFSKLEFVILEKTGVPVFGLTPVVQMLWMLGLIPVVRGAAHLINGIFFAPSRLEREAQQQTPSFTQNYVQPPSSYISPAAGATTSDLEKEQSGRPQPNNNPQTSVTEDATLRFEPK